MRSIQKTSTADTVVNQGLRSYFNDVFSRMTTALLDYHSGTTGIRVGHEFRSRAVL